MTTAAPSAALAMIQPVFSDPERLALAGLLAGYRGLGGARNGSPNCTRCPPGATGFASRSTPPPASRSWRSRYACPPWATGGQANGAQAPADRAAPGCPACPVTGP